MAGIFVTRGMTVTIPAGGLTLGVGPDGKIKSNVEIHVRFDACLTWIELSLRHLEAAREAKELRVAAWQGEDPRAKAAALEREFEASMQAAVAAATAIEAFYAVVQQSTSLPGELLAKWRSGRTARYTQVAEVLRRAFSLKPNGVRNLRGLLRDVYKYRDWAVHPSGKTQAAVLHPDLGVGVEWRFAAFRADNAEQLVWAASGIVWDLAHNSKPKSSHIQKYAQALRERLAEVFPDGHPLEAAKTKSPQAEGQS